MGLRTRATKWIRHKREGKKRKGKERKKGKKKKKKKEKRKEKRKRKKTESIFHRQNPPPPVSHSSREIRWRASRRCRVWRRGRAKHPVGGEALEAPGQWCRSLVEINFKYAHAPRVEERTQKPKPKRAEHSVRQRTVLPFLEGWWLCNVRHTME